MRAWLRQTAARIAALFRRGRHDAELLEDLETHLELLTEDYIRRGTPPEEARRQARLRFGSVVSVSELHRDVRSLRWIETVGLETRWAWRAVRARGWQAVLVILLLGIALAANTIVFSAADAFIFRRAPYTESDRLVLMQYTSSFGVSHGFSGPAILEWRRQHELFSSVEAQNVAAPFYLTMSDITEAMPAVRVTTGFLDMLGASPVRGRLFMESDAEKGAPKVAVIGEDLADRVFGDAASAVGAELPASDGPFRVVGVVPRSFRFPTARERIWLPLGLVGQPRNVGFDTIAQLAPGLSLPEAQARIAALAESIDKRTGSFGKRYPLTLRTLADSRENARYAGIFGMLSAAALCLLLIACANVASLELAVALRRARAMGVRAALGAGRAALVRVQLLESAMLCALSGGVAAVLAGWGMAALTNTFPPAMAQELSNAIDWDRRAILVAVVATAVTWLMTSAPAAWRASRTQLVDVLADEGRAGALSPHTRFLRSALVVGQVAATVLLLTIAMLFMRSYEARLRVDKGLDASSVAVVRVLPAFDAPLKGPELAEAVREALTSHSAVGAIALADNVYPSLGGWIGGRLSINGGDPVGEIVAHGHGVAPEYFATMGIRLTAGTWFDADAPASKVVLDERFAHAFWPPGGAIGSRFRIGGAGYAGASEWEVVGVARHVRPGRLTIEGGRDLFVFYYPMRPPRTAVTAVVKLEDERALAAIVGRARAVAPRSAVRADMIDDLYARLEGDRAIAAAVSSGMATLALGVATLGIYAVMAFIVAGRRREIGIRLALGATAGDVRRQVLAQSMTLVVVGCVAGLFAAAGASRWLDSQLYGVSATEPLTYAAVTAAVIAMAAAATWHPARQAARVDPAITLRSQ